MIKAGKAITGQSPALRTEQSPALRTGQSPALNTGQSPALNTGQTQSSKQSSGFHSSQSLSSNSNQNVSFGPSLSGSKPLANIFLSNNKSNFEVRNTQGYLITNIPITTNLDNSPDSFEDLLKDFLESSAQSMELLKSQAMEIPSRNSIVSPLGRNSIASPLGHNFIIESRQMLKQPVNYISDEIFAKIEDRIIIELGNKVAHLTENIPENWHLIQRGLFKFFNNNSNDYSVLTHRFAYGLAVLNPLSYCVCKGADSNYILRWTDKISNEKHNYILGKHFDYQFFLLQNVLIVLIFVTQEPISPPLEKPKPKPYFVPQFLN